METTVHKEPAAFTGLYDLASERLGGAVLAANDEFFAEKENLVKDSAPVFEVDRYTDRGKWMDGWETRRRRTPGHDWCVLRLGLPGFIRGVNIDTAFFLGNHPSHASLEACSVAHDPAGEALTDDSRWTEILPKTELKPGSQNLFAIKDRSRWTHVRLRIYPDGGVARLRVYGAVAPVTPAKGAKDANAPVDLAAMDAGGLVIAASDMFFGSRENLIMPGRSQSMRDGWETKRRRGPGHDWSIVRLGHPGTIARIEVDTSHFKGNYPDRCSIDSCAAPDPSIFEPVLPPEAAWAQILTETKLGPDQVHVFQPAATGNVVTHVRLHIYPDGGVARLRVFGVRESI